MASRNPLRPLCFVVMPYGIKATNAEAGKGPASINFNALWDKAYAPALLELNYQPVRADQDTGALIITQMLERLYFADLVVADMTIPNGNVYYEIGIRHAARRSGCVLLAAEWSQQLFDVAQMRTAKYPLVEGEITDETAAAIREVIKLQIPRMKVGESPMHEAIPGYPSAVADSTAAGMKDQMAMQSVFQAEVRAVRAAPKSERLARARALAESYSQIPMTPAVAIALMLVLRDCADVAEDWNVVIGFIDGLSEELRSLAEVVEQRALALSNAGHHVEAIAALDALVTSLGPTQERLGMLGGRYKRLLKNATTESDRRTALAKSIDYYERGMDLDLNDYYCSGNLPGLYRMRGRLGDEDRAKSTLQLVIAACERALRRDAIDPWLRPTLLVAAFDAHDATKAEELADQVEDEGAAKWQLASILANMSNSVSHVEDVAIKARLAALIERFQRL